MKVEAAATGWRITYPEDVVAFQTIHAEATGADLPADEVHLELLLPFTEDGVAEDGYICTSIKFIGAPITGEALRQLPIAEIVSRAVVDSIDFLKATRDGRLRIVWGDDTARPTMPTGRAGPSEDLLRYVARIYRIALLAGHAPTAYVAGDLDIPRATAGRWVARARENGFLMAAPPRRPD